MKLYKGFTLIEMMIVMAVIGILTALVTPSLQKALNKRNGTTTELIEQVTDQKIPPAEILKDTETVNNVSVVVLVTLTIISIASVIVIIFTLISRRKIKAQLNLSSPAYFLYGKPENSPERADTYGELMDEKLKKPIRKDKQSKGLLQILMTQIKRIWDIIIEVLLLEKGGPQ